MALHTTLPPPPFAETGVAVTENCVTAFKAKVAVTVESAFSVIEQLTGPVQLTLPVPLLQPVKVESALATPWRTSAVPFGYGPAQALKVAPPSVLHVTVPVPVPACAIVSVAGGKAEGNVAVTGVSAVIVTTHVPVPEQPPLHPVNPVPVAVNVTTALV